MSFSNLTNQNFGNFTADANTITNADSCNNAGLAFIPAPPPQANLTFNNRGPRNRIYIWNAGAACTSGNLVLQAQFDGGGKATFNKSTFAANQSYKILVTQQDANNQAAWASNAKSYNATVDAGGNVMNVGTQNNVQIDNATIDLNQASQDACDPAALNYIAP